MMTTNLMEELENREKELKQQLRQIEEQKECFLRSEWKKALEPFLGFTAKVKEDIEDFVIINCEDFVHSADVTGIFFKDGQLNICVNISCN